MKVFIGADIEGTADLAAFEEAGQESPALYTRGMVQMSKEVAAACRGAQRAGASFIAVKDAHGNGMNIMHEYLPEAVTLIRGEGKNPYSMIAGIDKSYDAVMFVGYHDAAGQNGNPMAHTISSRRIREVTINGVAAGELHIFAYAAANLGIPTVLVSGDAGICEKAKAIHPKIETVSTKHGFGGAVASIHPAMAEKLLERAAESALSGDLSRYAVTLPKQFHITVAYHKHFEAERASYYPNAKKIDPHTIAFDTDDYYDALRLFFFVL